ncbi:hypothetical protein C0Q70_16557 [Pomacea canaliculata]|uniref:G-protein coupled receptors family 1 profile domain-containing protein n=1 Tax=Pomacea canaliculata TaxID=400727 RepID=A0A2T7NQ44_POMCA|nr:hypothetical protein C0Q70_16557 [Pomacea canaliculata]
MPAAPVCRFVDIIPLEHPSCESCRCVVGPNIRCTSPVTGVLLYFPMSSIPPLAMLAHWLCYFNSSINPAIYNFMSCERLSYKNIVI